MKVNFKLSGRRPDCGSGGRGFKSRHSPQFFRFTKKRGLSRDALTRDGPILRALVSLKL